MAFEIYDDIAWFWFILTLVGIALIPYSFYMVRFLREEPPEPNEEKTSTLGKKKIEKFRQDYKKASSSRYRSGRFILFVILWVGFLYGLLQVETMQHEEMQVFDPYKILGVEVGANETDIKKAYRKLSRIYHPDKNPGDDEAAQKFMLLAKAEQTLTDEVSRNNWETFGNPDGYTGTSVTIGLPSGLLNKDNELLILLIYFVLIVVIPPIVVGLWWRKTKNVHETGVLLDSIQKYQAFIQQQTPTKLFVEILCTAGEFSPSYIREKIFNQDMSRDLQRLHGDIKEDLPNGGKARTPIQYAMWGTVLLYAHMMRNTAELRKDALRYLDIILNKCHKLMSVMLDITIARFRRIEPVSNLVVLSQHIVQAVYFGESNLYQLPHLGPNHVRALKMAKGTPAGVPKERITRVSQLARLSPEARRERLDGLDETQIQDIERVIGLLPDLQMEIDWEVGDEKGLYDGDLVQLNIRLRRQPASADDDDAGGIGGDVGAGVDGRTAVEDGIGGGDEDDYKIRLVGEDEESDDEGLFEEQQKKRAEAKKRKDIAPLPVHAPYFPALKNEKWLILLCSPGGQIFWVERVATLREATTVNMFVRAAKGKMEYEVHAMCDSYIGCDKMVPLTLKVKAKPEVKAETKVLLKDDDDVDDMLADDEEEEEWPLWMHVLDITATILLLSFIMFGLYTYFSQKPWFIANIAPKLDAIREFIRPVTSKFDPIVVPLMELFDKYVAPHIYVEDHEPVPIDPSRAHYWQRAGIGAA